VSAHNAGVRSSRAARRGRPKTYFTCNNARVNGACVNRLSLTVSDLDRVVVETIRKYILTPEIVEDVITRAIKLYASEADVYAERRESRAAPGRAPAVHGGHPTRRPARLPGGRDQEHRAASSRRAGPAGASRGAGEGPGVGRHPPRGDRSTVGRVADARRAGARGRAAVASGSWWGA